MKTIFALLVVASALCACTRSPAAPDAPADAVYVLALTHTPTASPVGDTLAMVAGETRPITVALVGGCALPAGARIVLGIGGGSTALLTDAQSGPHSTRAIVSGAWAGLTVLRAALVLASGDTAAEMTVPVHVFPVLRFVAYAEGWAEGDSQSVAITPGPPTMAGGAFVNTDSTARTLRIVVKDNQTGAVLDGQLSVYMWCWFAGYVQEQQGDTLVVTVIPRTYGILWGPCGLQARFVSRHWPNQSHPEVTVMLHFPQPRDAFPQPRG